MICDLNAAVILGRRSFFNPWGFDYDNYCSLPELSGMFEASGLRPTHRWGVTSAMPWFLNSFFLFLKIDCN